MADGNTAGERTSGPRKEAVEDPSAHSCCLTPKDLRWASTPPAQKKVTFVSLVPLLVKYRPWKHTTRSFKIWDGKWDSRPKRQKNGKKESLSAHFLHFILVLLPAEVAHMSSPPVTSCFCSAGMARRSHTRWNICRPFSVSWGHFPFWLLTLSLLCILIPLWRYAAEKCFPELNIPASELLPVSVLEK